MWTSFVDYMKEEEPAQEGSEEPPQEDSEEEQAQEDSDQDDEELPLTVTSTTKSVEKVRTRRTKTLRMNDKTVLLAGSRVPIAPFSRDLAAELEAVDPDAS